MYIIIRSLLLLLSVTVSLQGQSVIEKHFEAQGIRNITVNFKYPQTIKVRGWDEPRVVIKAQVSINNGLNDDAFKIEQAMTEGTLVISAEIEGLEELPKKITAKRGDTMYFFNTSDWQDPEVQKFFNQHGHDYDYISHGIMKDISIEVFVPNHIALQVNAQYGLVEILDLQSSLEVNAQYGGIDVQIPSNGNLEILASTRYGEMYSNMEDALVDQNEAKDFSKWTTVRMLINEPEILWKLESKYGNIYLRKKQ